jgi:hypothetical protein
MPLPDIANYLMLSVVNGMVVKKAEIEISTQVNPVRPQTGNLADGKRSR